MQLVNTTLDHLLETCENASHITLLSFRELGACGDISQGICETVFSAIYNAAVLNDNGQVVVLVGFSPDPRREKQAYVWVVPTHRVYENNRAFLHFSRQLIAMVYELGDWERQLSYIDSLHNRSLQWAKRWLGFTHTLDLPCFGMSMRPFHEVVHTRGKSKLFAKPVENFPCGTPGLELQKQWQEREAAQQA